MSVGCMLLQLFCSYCVKSFVLLHYYFAKYMHSMQYGYFL